jgi:EAL domain-containing protein (putative c-di-GMP-specific phosphodiesterase class I)
MQVVAEGVETAGQLDCLRADGCDIAQGYFFSRPLPPTELLSWLRARADRVKGSRETDDLAAGSS